MRKILYLSVSLFVLICLVVMGSVSAQNMSFSTIGPMGPQTVQLYSSNGTLVGTFNTSTAGISLPTEDFSILMIPQTSDLIADPPVFLVYMMDIISANLINIVILGLVLWLAFGGRRR